MNRSLRSQRDDRGVVALELVIVLPILLMLIIGTVVLGNFLNLKTQTSGLARDGARDAALRQTPRAGHRHHRGRLRRPLDPTDGHGHRAGHQDRGTAQHPSASRPAPGHHHGNGDHAMRRLTETRSRRQRGRHDLRRPRHDGHGRRCSIRHRRGRLRRRSSIGPEQRRCHRARGRHRLCTHRRPDRRLLAVPQGRPDHHHAGVRRWRSHDHRDQGRRRSPPRAERRRRQPERHRPVGDPQRGEDRADRHRELRIRRSSPRRHDQTSSSTSTTRSRRPDAPHCPAASANSTRTPARCPDHRWRHGLRASQAAASIRSCRASPTADPALRFHAPSSSRCTTQLHASDEVLQGQRPVPDPRVRRLQGDGLLVQRRTTSPGPLGKNCPDDSTSASTASEADFVEIHIRRDSQVPAPTSVSPRSTSTANTQLTTRRTTPQ